MNFITETLITNSFIEQFREFLLNRRRQLQDWDGQPPHQLGWIIFGFVTFEWILARRLFWGDGIQIGIIGEWFSLCVVILVIEAVLVKVANEMSGFFKKKGDWKTAFTFLHIGLFPLLLILPISFLAWAGGQWTLIRIIAILALMYKVLSNWKESIEISHELSRLQSAIVIYISIGSILFVLILFSYISFISRFNSVFSSLG